MESRKEWKQVSDGGGQRENYVRSFSLPQEATFILFKTIMKICRRPPLETPKTIASRRHNGQDIFSCGGRKRKGSNEKREDYRLRRGYGAVGGVLTTA